MCGKECNCQGKSLDPCKIKLEKNSKGFNWEISMIGEDFPSILKKIDEINEVMKAKYGGA